MVQFSLTLSLDNIWTTTIGTTELSSVLKRFTIVNMLLVWIPRLEASLSTLDYRSVTTERIHLNHLNYSLMYISNQLRKCCVLQGFVLTFQLYFCSPTAPLCSICHQFSRIGCPEDYLLEHLEWTHKRYELTSGSAEECGEACRRCSSHELEGGSILFLLIYQ